MNIKFLHYNSVIKVSISKENSILMTFFKIYLYPCQISLVNIVEPQEK